MKGLREANKPDSTITKDLFDVTFAEIKAPKYNNSTGFILRTNGQWPRSQDTIDMHLRRQRIMTSIYCIQIFGKQEISEIG